MNCILSTPLSLRLAFQDAMLDTGRIAPFFGPMANAPMNIPPVIGINAGARSLSG
jgi:hypothetical protein